MEPVSLECFRALTLQEKWQQLALQAQAWAGTTDCVDSADPLTAFYAAITQISNT